MKNFVVYHTLTTNFSDEDVVNWMKSNDTLPKNATEYEPTGQDITDYAYFLFKKGDYTYADEQIFTL